MSKRIIWQYWETVGTKPRYIDGLRQLVRQNSGVESILVTPETLKDYLPNLPEHLAAIGEIAHKADMIRSMLVQRHGGMWLDSDAIVLQDLNWMFRYLDHYEFIGFNDRGRLRSGRPWVRVNCFLSRPNGAVISEWVRRQHAKFPKTVYAWTEIGTDLLHPICLEHRATVKMLPFERICPIKWDEVEKFTSKMINSAPILRKCIIVMLSNSILGRTQSALRELTVEEIAAGDYLLSSIMQHAISPPAPSRFILQSIIPLLARGR